MNYMIWTVKVKGKSNKNNLLITWQSYENVYKIYIIFYFFVSLDGYSKWIS